MSNPGDQSARRLRRLDPAGTDADEAQRRGRALANFLLLVAALLGGTEAAAYYFHSLQIWQSYIMTPLVPILVTLALFTEYELSIMREPWRRHRVHDDFTKSSLMMLGTVAAALGLVVFMVSISAELYRVTVDVAAGSTMICAGVYVVKRFSW